jgi:hypothetical protein
MKSKIIENITRYLLSFVCFTAYLFLFLAVIANAYRTNVFDFLLS